MGSQAPTGPRFGVAYGLSPYGVPTVRDIVAFGELAEAVGLDDLWLADHVVMYSPILDPLCLLSALAVRTKRIRLGTAIYLLPLRPPATVAKAVATLDHLSEGRFIFGIGVGGENPKEFEVSGVPVNERGARTNESIQILRRLWSEDGVTHRGRFWQFEDVTMEPKPVQQGGPKIWAGGRSDAALKRAATLCDGWMGYLFAPEQFKQRVDRISELAAAAGREIFDFTPSMHLFLSLDADGAFARRRAVEYLGLLYHQDFERLVDRYCLAGTVEHCAQRLAEYVSAGAGEVTLRLAVGPTHFRSQIELAARELIPQARQLLR